MRRKIRLSALHVGRCFIHVMDEDETPDTVGAVVHINTAWRVVASEGGKVRAERVDGQVHLLEGACEVAEIPVEGYQKLRASFLATLDEEA